MILTSPDFGQGGLIPEKFTCDGQDISPALEWGEAPSGTKAFVLICDDPDAPMGTWNHWILFNIPGNVTGLPQNIKNLPNGTQEGQNSWGNTGYGGPCPPDKIHRYFFKLYALEKELDLASGATKAEVEAAMDDLILARAELMASYDRPR